jgi:hypothetical protein
MWTGVLLLGTEFAGIEVGAHGRDVSQVMRVVSQVYSRSGYGE